MAMGNKFYDAVVFGLPQLCVEGSHMAKIVEEKGVGIGCNPWDEDFSLKVYDYYRSINWNDFDSRCGDLLASITTDLHDADSVISQFMGESSSV